MSSWAGIESGAGAGPDPSSMPSPATQRESSARRNRGDASRDETTGLRRLRRQPRPIIGSLDGAGVMVQRTMREVVLGAAWILLPGVLLNLVATSLAFDRYQTFKGSAVSIPELLGGEQAATGIEELLWYVGLVINSLAACLVGGYVAILAVRWRMGRTIGVRIGYRGVLPRLPALMVAWLIGHCWFPIVVVVLGQVSTSSLAPLAILGAPLVLVAATMTLVVAPAIVVEGLGPVAGLRRAWRLGRANFGMFFAFVVCSVLIGLLVQYGIAYLPRLLQATGLVTFGRFGWLIEGVAGQLGRLISTPLVAIATVFVYLESRMTNEGMDLVLDADRAFGVPT